MEQAQGPYAWVLKGERPEPTSSNWRNFGLPNSIWRKLRPCEQYLEDTQGQGPQTLIGQHSGPRNSNWRKLKAQEEEIQGPAGAVTGGIHGLGAVAGGNFRA